MDEIDRGIMEILMQNSRATYKDISEKIGISEVAVHKRIKKLKGMIKAFTILVDQKILGKGNTAVLLLRCEVGKTREIAERLKEIEDICEVYTTVGEYDIIAKIRTKNTESLKQLVEKKISMISGINELRASIVFECFKENVNLVLCP